jgi:hypothetical protein
LRDREKIVFTNGGFLYKIKGRLAAAAGCRSCPINIVAAAADTARGKKMHQAGHAVGMQPNSWALP